MTFNRIQFDYGMWLPEFLRCFGSAAQRAAALTVARWPGGFRCPRCSSGAHDVVGHGARRLLCRKYAARYRAAFAYRFNRGFDLRDLVSRLIVDVARCAPVREQVVRSHAEARFWSGQLMR